MHDGYCPRAVSWPERDDNFTLISVTLSIVAWNNLSMAKSQKGHRTNTNNNAFWPQNIQISFHNPIMTIRKATTVTARFIRLHLLNHMRVIRIDGVSTGRSASMNWLRRRFAVAAPVNWFYFLVRLAVFVHLVDDEFDCKRA